MSHKPNPFDFVPFVESGPNLYPLKEFVESDKLLTGYLTVCMKALTPVHIVGKQEAEELVPEIKQDKKNYKILRSKFLRRGGDPLIPSSTIRGCLRSFIEAVTNGWVSEFTPYYKSDKGKRKHGFKVDKNVHIENEIGSINQQIPAALDSKYIIPPEGSDRIDIASFLFGFTPEEGMGRKGCIVIEDAMIDDGCLDGFGEYKVPDITDSAFMGGPKPSASSWWYQYPYKISMRESRKKDGMPIVIVDFIGSGFRGRKFYYHQDQSACVGLYSSQNSQWPQRSGHPLYTYPLECLTPGEKTQDFRIYFEEIPESLLKILILSLMPSGSWTEKRTQTLRHKIGYGKAYGFGSVDFMITGGRIKGESRVVNGESIVGKLLDEVNSSLWDFEKLFAIGIGQYLHKESVERIAKILWFDSSEQILFQYPPFGNNGFLPVISKSDLESVLAQGQRQNLDRFKRFTVTNAAGKQIAKSLYENGRRKALHFEVYQENADKYKGHL